jgi:hypothetical protein
MIHCSKKELPLEIAKRKFQEFGKGELGEHF